MGQRFTKRQGMPPDLSTIALGPHSGERRYRSADDKRHYLRKLRRDFG